MLARYVLWLGCAKRKGLSPHFVASLFVARAAMSKVTITNPMSQMKKSQTEPVESSKAADAIGAVTTGAGGGGAKAADAIGAVTIGAGGGGAGFPDSVRAK